MQGAQILSQHGVNVPPGLPVFSLAEVTQAAEEMASPDGEVPFVHIQPYWRRLPVLPSCKVAALFI